MCLPICPHATSLSNTECLEMTKCGHLLHTNPHQLHGFAAFHSSRYQASPGKSKHPYGPLYHFKKSTHESSTKTSQKRFGSNFPFTRIVCSSSKSQEHHQEVQLSFRQNCSSSDSRNTLPNHKGSIKEPIDNPP